MNNNFGRKSIKNFFTHGAILCVWGERKCTFRTTTVTHILWKKKRRKKEINHQKLTETVEQEEEEEKEDKSRKKSKCQKYPKITETKYKIERINSISDI